MEKYKKYKLGKKKKAVLLFFIIILCFLVWLSIENYITFEELKKNSDVLKQFVHAHYVESVLVFILFFISTAFFVPGAIVTTIAGGFLFGIVEGVIYVNIGSTIGATIAFLSSRYLLGNYIQHRYAKQLMIFNKEIERHGHNYLIVLRIIPVLPFFIVNYLSGITKISTRKFVFITSLSMLPGSVIYTFAGQELGALHSPEDVLSFEFFVALGLLALFVLLPVIINHGKRLWNR
jgi:uncharacterized membrane protein YdjX (TVP38/TMEM64 family)